MIPPIDPNIQPTWEIIDGRDVPVCSRECPKVNYCDWFGTEGPLDDPCIPYLLAQVEWLEAQIAEREANPNEV